MFVSLIDVDRLFLRDLQRFGDGPHMQEADETRRLLCLFGMFQLLDEFDVFGSWAFRPVSFGV